ncbi:hypocretin (orexin) receptor 2 [Mytilus galloprovincialis]|uniref:Hypocretin (Orexin) receptor 2 n=1 Tax=Mytilus galloprovincialis TaxID=29158 RepID=A0A8B6C4M5_MYTGA|nr:hypocretin (orexin) receptor 2 [Mytilus galloprovincialis]
MSSANITDTHAELVRLNDEKALFYLPVIIYMLILMFVGTFGNILVCFVYLSKQTKTSSHYFILALAMLDLLTCLVGMPTEVADLRYPYMFYAPAACKLLRFIESVSIIGSSIILIAVAFDRFFRICRLGKQVTVKHAKIACLLSVVVGILAAWPACILFGEKSVDIGLEGVNAIDCSTDDSMRGTVYPTVYYGFLFLLFIGCFVFFTIIYLQIGVVIWKRKRTNIGEKLPETPTSKERPSSDGVSNDPISTEMSSGNDGSWESERRKSTISARNFKKQSSKNQIKVTRTTVVLFAVTVAYVISFLPFLIVMVLRSTKKDFEESLTSAGEMLYKFCSKSYFINNAINPCIYSFLNINFRKDTKNLIKRILASCCCRNRGGTTV